MTQRSSCDRAYLDDIKQLCYDHKLQLYMNPQEEFAVFSSTLFLTGKKISLSDSFQEIFHQLKSWVSQEQRKRRASGIINIKKHLKESTPC